MAGVTTCNEVYENLTDRWERCRDCSIGGDAVKARGSKYLPLLDSHKEKYEKYLDYQRRALFYNATGRTIAGLSGAIFQKAPSIETDSKVKEQATDITLAGEPLDVFALNITKEYLITGRFGILVDMSSEPATEPRPYWLMYRAEDIINWRFAKFGGDQELVFAVLREYIDRPKITDEFDIEQIVQYRVLRLNDGIYTQQIYIEEKSQNGSNATKYVAGPIAIPQRRGKALDFIPFALPWGIIQPPLLDLVDVNLAHYRGSADLKHGLHYVALPTPWVSGLASANKGEPLNIGAGTAWILEKDGTAGMLEFTGAGLGAIRLDLQDMQNLMATLGARLLEQAPRYAETALSVSMRHSSDYATLRTIAQVVEQLLSFALKIHSWWLGTDSLVEANPSKIELNKVFFDQSLTADELRALLLALQSNSISYKTFYARLASTGWTREGIDNEEEAKEIANNPPEVGIKPAPAPGVVN